MTLNPFIEGMPKRLLLVSLTRCVGGIDPRCLYSSISLHFQLR